MGDAPKETALAPAPADVVALVLAITGSAWPATDAALRQLHAMQQRLESLDATVARSLLR